MRQTQITHHKFRDASQRGLQWYLKNEKKIQKYTFIAFCLLLLAYTLILVLYGTIKGLIIALDQQQAQQFANAYGIAPILIVIIIYAVLLVLFILLIRPFLLILNSAQVFLVDLGGKGMMQSIVGDRQITSIVGIFAGIALVLVILFIAVRGIKLAVEKNAEKQEGLRRNTATAIFGAVLGLFVMTAAFIFGVGLLCQISSWIIDTFGLNNQQIGLMVFNYSCYVGIGHDTVIPWYIPVDFQHSVLMMVLLGIAATLFLFRFLIGTIGTIFKIIILYIFSFIALSKWPQDEGGSFNGHRDDLVSLFLSYALLFFLYNIFMILFSVITPIAQTYDAAQNFLMPGVISCCIFAAGTVATTQLTKRLPELLSLKRESTATIGGRQDVSGAAGSVKDNLSSKGNTLTRSAAKTVEKMNKTSKETTKTSTKMADKVAKVAAKGAK